MKKESKPYAKEQEFVSIGEPVPKFDSFEGYEFSKIGTLPPSSPLLPVNNIDGYIQPDSALYTILSMPKLVICRKYKTWKNSKHFDTYYITDEFGNHLGYIIEDSTTDGPRSENIQLVMFDIYGNELMKIKQKSSKFRYHYQALINDPATDEDVEFGRTEGKTTLLKKKFDLRQQSVGIKDQYNLFAKVRKLSRGKDFVATNGVGGIYAAVTHQSLGIKKELLTDSAVFILRMDPSVLGVNLDNSIKKFVEISIDQRAILLTTVIGIDFEFYNTEKSVTNVIYSSAPII